MTDHTSPDPLDPHTPHSAHDFGHVLPMKLLVAIFAALTVLTILTVAVSRVDLGSLNLYVALAIACIKASLVVLIFMHLLYDRPFNAVIFIGCLIFVTLFISIALTDSTAYHHTVIPGQAPGIKHVPINSAPESPAPAAAPTPAPAAK